MKAAWCAVLVALALIVARAQQPAPPFDLLITNARIIDGTGGPSVTGAVGVRGGRIAAVGQAAGPAARTIDAHGQVLAPGFIDAHSHSDVSLLTDGNAESKIRQGVTTEVIGESGSVAPRAPLASRAAAADTRGTGVRPDWTDFSGYFAAVERSKISVNLLSYIGLGQVREFVMGNDERAPTPDELRCSSPRRFRPERWAIG